MTHILGVDIGTTGRPHQEKMDARRQLHSRRRILHEGAALLGLKYLNE
jgi:hypothetical protein